MQTILKKRLNLRKVCARWVPHLLTEEQKTQGLKCARECLKTYKGCNSWVISNLLTGDETWVHMFEPQRGADNKHLFTCHRRIMPRLAELLLASEKVKVLNHPPYSPDLSPCDFFLFPRLKKMLSGNKQWKRKDQNRPCIAKRTISSKKIYAIFFNSRRPVVQMPCPSSHTRILYWRKWKSFTIRNDQAKDGQESTFYMTTPPLISVRLLSCFYTPVWKTGRIMLRGMVSVRP